MAHVATTFVYQGKTFRRQVSFCAVSTCMQSCTFFKFYVHSSFFAAFCHVLLHFVCMYGRDNKVIIKQKQVIIKQKQTDVNKIDIFKLVNLV